MSISVGSSEHMTEPNQRVAGAYARYRCHPFSA